MSMCDRCRVSGCLLNYNGKACEKARQETCPDVYYTNADHIRSMTDEELACYLSLIADLKSGEIVFKDTSGKWLNWLKQPHKEKIK